jgi:hypothetical protein
MSGEVLVAREGAPPVSANISFDEDGHVGVSLD